MKLLTAVFLAFWINALVFLSNNVSPQLFLPVWFAAVGGIIFLLTFLESLVNKIWRKL